VDVGLAVTGLRGAYGATLRGAHYSVLQDHAPYSADAYPRHERVAAAQLIDPRDLVRDLLRHLFDATTARDDYDPFRSD
jgi:hypothetical protein